ncbi:hypothetical protein JZ751_024468 [Albula glossodonta]|uniref:Uncharacterized protein n=1 Tax=Albula glossodonta TaxID=121402 RepID=A0A8T2PEE2_9TELE|nr:hypothetical protein JZ751_024468 [Albula glossodonta]
MNELKKVTTGTRYQQYARLLSASLDASLKCQAGWGGRAASLERGQYLTTPKKTKELLCEKTEVLLKNSTLQMSHPTHCSPEAWSNLHLLLIDMLIIDAAF